MAKRYEVKELAGKYILFIVVADLTDTLLIKHLELAMKTQDFEYCEAIAAEAILRGLPIHSSIKKYLNG